MLIGGLGDSIQRDGWDGSLVFEMLLGGFLRSASSRRGEKGTSAGQDMTTNIDILLVHDDSRYVSGVHIGYCNYCSGCRQKFQRTLGTPICGLEQL